MLVIYFCKGLYYERLFLCIFSLEAKGNTKENESQWLITFIDFDKVFMKIL
jgi:hypothetical protein